MKAITMLPTLEDFESILEELDIKTIPINENNITSFYRMISFKIYNQIYLIEWYKNNSTLFVGDNKNHRAPRIPFKYMYIDTTYPLVNENKSLGFSYVKYKPESIFDSLYPYETFRIPLEIKT